MAKVALLKFKSDVIKAARAGLKEAATILENKIIQNATLTDHSLADLAALGHPYSKRAPQEIHDPNYQVHTQSGKLQDNIRQVKEGPNAIAVGVDPIVPYLDDVIEGNSVMIARPFIRESFAEVGPDIFKAIEDEIKVVTD